MNTKIFLCVLLIITFSITAFSEIGNLPGRVQHMLETLLDGGVLQVAGYPVTHQVSPAAAFSSVSGEYLVVYEDSAGNGDIKGQFIDADTGLYSGGRFDIAAGSAEELNPDVVYDPIQNRFLVVWESLYCGGGFCYYEIHGVLVYGSNRDGGNIAGGEFLIASDHRTDDQGYNLVTPRAVYNADDQEYAVIYLKRLYSNWKNEAVFGQIIASDAELPTVLTDEFTGFEISAHSGDQEAFNAEIAWSPDGDTYLVVWERYDPANVDYIFFQHLHDTYQGPGNNQLSGHGGQVAPVASMGNVTGEDEYNDPAVAYDAQDKNYLVVFVHTDTSGLSGEARIYGMRVSNHYLGPQRAVGDPIEVATTITANYTGHYDPHIDHSGQADEMYMVYLTEYLDAGDFKYLVNESTIRGRYAHPSLQVQSGYPNTYLSYPKVIGTGDGRGLVVWSEEYSQNPYDWDVRGQRIKSYSKVYLPAVSRGN